MKPILLIAANFLREQRWAVILLLAWVVFSALISSFSQLDRADVLFFIKQQAVYAVAFSAFLASSAIHNERRSRRILAVLSKGINRAQYLAGLLSGVLIAAAIYLTAMGVFGSLMFRAVAIPAVQLWWLLALLAVSCAVGATTALLFATFTPPLVAVSFTALALGFGAGMSAVGASHSVLPVYTLMDVITHYEFQAHWNPHWRVALWGLAESVALWLFASLVFGLRDIALPVE